MFTELTRNFRAVFKTQNLKMTTTDIQEKGHELRKNRFVNEPCFHNMIPKSWCYLFSAV